jgi:uncharacterized phage protein gp47/JayE
MLTLEQLTTPVTQDEALATSLTVLSQLGFQATSWQSGSIQLTILNLFCSTWSSLSNVISQIAAGGFTTLSSGNWLTLLAQYVYGLTRLAANPTIGQILLTSSAGAPVTTFSAGDIIVADQPNGTSGANTYTCTQGGTLGPGSTLSVTFQANVAGSAGNIAPSTTLYLWTPLVGITATNPALAPASNTWVTTPGQDPEADARLAARCLGAWAKLTYSNIDGAYIAWALDALPTLTRAQILSAPGDGTVTLVGATALGPIDSGDITTIQNYVNGITDGVGRRPINDIFTAVGATTVTSPALTITAYCISNVQGTVAAAITQALLNYLGTVPIGGSLLTTTQGRVIFSELVAVAQAVAGVRSVVFNISTDILLSPGQIYLPAITVNVLPVAPGN